MSRVGKFEKVSFEQFFSAMKDEFYYTDEDMEMVMALYKNIELPTRATSGSAGYDFKCPLACFTLHPGETIKIPTGVRVRIDKGWFLGIFPRSSLGFKYRVQLDNTVGVIDSDYYNSDNEGHIFVKLTNDGKADKTVAISAGDAFAQGIFLPFGMTYDDEATGIRNGGFGSTNNV